MSAMSFVRQWRLFVLFASPVLCSNGGVSFNGSKPTTGFSYVCGDGIFTCNGTEAFIYFPDQWIPYVPRFPDSISQVTIVGATTGSLPGYFFSNLTNIRVLNIQTSKITTLSHNAFAGMDKLQRLTLDRILRLEVDSLREILSVPSLTHLELTYCNFSPLQKDVFQNVTSNITSLDFSHNPWGDVSQLDSFCALPSMDYLTCRHCNLDSIEMSSCQLTMLSTLDLSYNSLMLFPFTCNGTIRSKVSVFPNLKELYLRENEIITMGFEICLPSLTHLDLSNNMLTTLSSFIFGPNYFPILRVLDLQNQRLNIQITDEKDLVTHVIREHAFNNENLEELNLGNNELNFAADGNISRHAFANCSGLRYLNLDSNNVSFVDDGRFSELFGHLHSLDVLSMSNCRFESLSTSTFANFYNLTTLYLDGNMISELPDKVFDSLHRLESLYLDHNKINEISELTFSQHLRDNLTSLTLGFNPFHCSCDLLWFAQWYQTKQQKLFKDSTNVHNYKCQNLNGEPLASFSLVDQACLLSHQSHLLVIEFCSLFIFTLILVSVLFRYRWHIRLLVYDVFRGRDHLRRQRLRENHFEYDVFVSYASDDLPWVRWHLMPKLEDEMGLRLCLHERDFVPGRHIVDNIARCVDSSKKVLMVFSEGFVHSQWCQFELAYCLTHVLDYDDAVLVVCVDDVTSRQMTSSMRAVLRTMTYIQWRVGDRDATESFWGRLAQGLREILPPNEHYV